MKITKILLILLVVAYWSESFSQDYAFKVLATKGTNQVKSGENLSPIKTGAKLKSTDEIIVSENAYIGLVHSTGKPVELKKSGNYNVGELASKMGTGSSVLSKYTDFILSSNSADAKKNRLSATGAVHRGLDDIKLLLPENQNSIFNDTLSINWDAKGSGPYIVTLKNMFDDELFRKESVTNNLLVDLKDAKLAKESPILVEIRSKADPKSKSEQRIVKKLSTKEVAEINAALLGINNEIKENSSLKQLVLAGFFEEHKLIIDAMHSYENAIKLSPDVPSYKEDYEDFLLRNRLKTGK